MLRPADADTLAELGLPYAVTQDGAFTAVVISDYPIPKGLQPAVNKLLVRLPPGFPDAAPDMFWFASAVTTESGAAIAGTESLEPFDGGTWQRWSRHIQGEWRPGVDNLATYLAYVRACLHQAVAKAA